MLQENLQIVRQNIEKAAAKAKRSKEDILLIGVTKTISPARMNELAALGVRDFGENKVQELLSKYPEVTANSEETIHWHLIGHLQRNKVKYIIDKVCLIHSVDSQKLGLEIDRRAGELGMVKDILIEVNIGDEESKHGVSLEEAPKLAKELSIFPNIRVKGLMTVAPYVENPEENRILFKKMFQVFVDINKNIFDNRCMQFLSMGMTNDYMVAIEEGANMIRVGTGIFGSR